MLYFTMTITTETAVVRRWERIIKQVIIWHTLELGSTLLLMSDKCYIYFVYVLFLRKWSYTAVYIYIYTYIYCVLREWLTLE